jgi:hypothetical protein
LIQAASAAGNVKTGMAVVRYPVAPMVKFPSILAYFIVTVFLLLVKVKSTLSVSINFDSSVVDKVTFISGLMKRGAVSEMVW